MAVRASMNVSVTPEPERYVQGLVASGRYQSASEVFRDGLWVLEQAERRRLIEKWLTEGLTAEEETAIPVETLESVRSRLRAKIQEGLDALERGDVVGGEAFFEACAKNQPLPGLVTVKKLGLAASLHREGRPKVLIRGDKGLHNRRRPCFDALPRKLISLYHEHLASYHGCGGAVMHLAAFPCAGILASYRRQMHMESDVFCPRLA